MTKHLTITQLQVLQNAPFRVYWGETNRSERAIFNTLVKRGYLTRTTHKECPVFNEYTRTQKAYEALASFEIKRRLSKWNAAVSGEDGAE